MLIKDIKSRINKLKNTNQVEVVLHHPITVKKYTSEFSNS